MHTIKNQPCTVRTNNFNAARDAIPYNYIESECKKSQRTLKLLEIIGLMRD